MEKEILFVTTNKYKFVVAEKALKGTDIVLKQKSLDYEIPEIQSFEVEDVAEFSAKWICERLKEPVCVTDAGWYINYLNGFPGPFVKYINQWLKAEDILKLMNGVENRKVQVKETLAYCKPGEDPIAFNGSAFGTLALDKGQKGFTPMDQIFIPDGFDIVASEIDTDTMQRFWGSKINIWSKFKDYLVLVNK